LTSLNPSLNANPACRLVVLVPVYDDATAAALLLAQLEESFAGSDVVLRVIFVDDGSPTPLAQQMRLPPGLRAEVLRLRRNVGHQRAIALGTAHVHEHVPCDAMLVMDSDGEDRPQDAARLVARCRELSSDRIIFAERTRRSESALFQIFYRLYQLLHWMLTGIRVRVGNFSVVPAGRLAALVTLPGLWNHYAAAIFQARLPRELIPSTRGTRSSGLSKMNFVALVIHGLQAISVFIEIVTLRLLLAAGGLAGVCGMLVVLSLVLPFAVPLWAALFLGGLFVAGLCVAFGCFALTLGILSQRNSLDFVPSRDYHLFIEGVECVSSGQHATANALPSWDGERTILRPAAPPATAVRPTLQP